MLRLLCVSLLLGTYNTIAWLKFLNTPSTLRNGNVWSWTFEFDRTCIIATPYFIIQQ